jgi:hypothetical protein
VHSAYKKKFQKQDFPLCLHIQGAVLMVTLILHLILPSCLNYESFHCHAVMLVRTVQTILCFIYIDLMYIINKEALGDSLCFA